MTNHEASTVFLRAGRDLLTWVEYLDEGEDEELVKCARTVKALETVIINRKEHESM